MVVEISGSVVAVCSAAFSQMDVATCVFVVGPAYQSGPLERFIQRMLISRLSMSLCFAEEEQLIESSSRQLTGRRNKTSIISLQRAALHLPAYPRPCPPPARPASSGPEPARRNEVQTLFDLTTNSDICT